MKLFYWNVFPQSQRNSDNCGTKTNRKSLDGTRGDVLLEASHVFLVSTSGENPELNWSIALPLNNLVPLRELFANAQCTIKISTVFPFRRTKVDGAQRRWITKNVDVTQAKGAVSGKSCEEELQTCKHF